MPFKSHSKSKSEKEIAGNSKHEPAAGSLDKFGNIVLKILAKPGSKLNGITGVTAEGEIEVKISAPPVDGEVNVELISYLSKLFGVRKSDVSLEKGSRNRYKTVMIMKDAGKSVDDIEKIVKSNIEA